MFAVSINFWCLSEQNVDNIEMAKKKKAFSDDLAI